MTRRRFVLAIVVVLSLALGSVIAIAAIGPPKGRYKGSQAVMNYGSGSAHKISFRVRGGKLRKLAIGAGRAYCYPSRARQAGFAPGWIEAASPALRRFPAARVRRGRKGRYYVKVTYKRVNGRWRRTRESGRKQGPGYVAIRAVFKGKRLVPRGRLGFRVRYGADADGKPIWKSGPQQCIFEGRLRARRR